MTKPPPEPLALPAVQTSGNTGHLPPQAIEAEQSVLGAMLLSKDAIDTCIVHLSLDCFYKPAHKKIYRAIISLYERNEPADIVTVADELVAKNQLDDAGGRAYLAGLTEAVASIANVEHHAILIKNKALRLKLVDACNTTTSMAYDETVNVDELLNESERLIFSLKENSLKQTIRVIGDMAYDTYKNIEKACDGQLRGLPSGFSDLDGMTTGFQKSDLIILACRPSLGKTALSLNITEYLSIDNKIPILFFSLEMSADQLIQRFLSTRARVSSYKMRNGWLGDKDWTKLSNAIGPISEAPIYIDDTPTMNMLEMRAKARRQKSQNDIQMVIVDYLQLIDGSRGSESRQQEITYISRSLKAMARELNVPVIALSQLSRQVELRGPKARPQLSDLRESGAIEQDADVVIFIHRPLDGDGNRSTDTEILIRKQRNGPTGVIDMIFIPDYARFEQLEKHHADVNDNTAERY